ncbi:S-adenosyl-L-methionine-dependent methyltransferase [Syncephalis pseudoplumigaleata]|uniref:S-adenosyl-L-methionine-dependent methyltransferase n=1 Tax=Syncephalis pseudoplumigaleata TaxID=1712513 RepID=A0A4P9YZS0_9FUNG|nr:S-adenosyl-L-methionine-dependent methyltransferase [Syncephalis pseudoplumigaleata]|eukprot:RKP25102.1 S-adenosyl-L-methionine-dependent methyltransferase [Syncephalis pseudoplumigaleata]
MGQFSTKHPRIRRRGSDLPSSAERSLHTLSSKGSLDRGKHGLRALCVPNPFAAHDKRKKSTSSEQIGYLLPVNIHERERLNKQHVFMRAALGAHHFAPVSQPKKVLDVGTGTAIWIKDMAELWPSSRFYAIDTTHPDRQDVKFKFAFADLFDGLPYSDRTFEYVHQRFMFSAIPVHKWPSVLAELHRVTRPGGYLEVVDTSMRLSPAGPITSQLFAFMNNMLTANGIGMALAGDQLGGWLREAGFEPEERRIASVPIGEWGGEPGSMCFYSWCLLIRSLKDKLLSSNTLRSWDFELLMTEWQSEIEEMRTSCEILYL